MSRRENAHPRITSYAALANATFLLIVTAVVIVDGLKRLIDGTGHVDGLPVIIVSVVAALVMAVCALIIGTVEDDDLNMRSVMLDTLADAISSGGVAVSGAIILAVNGAYWLDPAVALGIALIIAYHAIKPDPRCAGPAEVGARDYSPRVRQSPSLSLTTPIARSSHKVRSTSGSDMAVAPTICRTLT
jgi:hypothetical protein